MTSDDTIDVRHLCPLPHAHAPVINDRDTICGHCTTKIRDHLADITRLWDLLPDLATSGRNGSGGCGTNSQPPTRLDILALTDPHTADSGDVPAATRWLTDIANWIAAARRLRTVTTTPAALQLLRVHYTALIAYPRPVQMHTHIGLIRNYLQRLAGEHRHPVATCQQPALDPQSDNDECGGAIYWTGNATGVIARCADCNDAWTDAVVWLHQQQQQLAQEREGA